MLLLTDKTKSQDTLRHRQRIPAIRFTDETWCHFSQVLRKDAPDGIIRYIMKITHPRHSQRLHVRQI